jgi:hypothetical protein
MSGLIHILVALFGLVGYPALGIAKSLTHRKGVEKAIVGAKGEQVDIWATQGVKDQDHAQITGRFERLFS